jgi:hypothetical protein
MKTKASWCAVFLCSKHGIYALLEYLAFSLARPPAFPHCNCNCNLRVAAYSLYGVRPQRWRRITSIPVFVGRCCPLCVCVCVQSSDRRANYILHPHLRRHQLTWWTTSPAPTILVEYVCWFVGLLTRRKKNERQRKKPFWTKVRRIYFGTKPIKVINTAVWC